MQGSRCAEYTNKDNSVMLRGLQPWGTDIVRFHAKVKDTAMPMRLRRAPRIGSCRTVGVMSCT